MNIPIDFNDFIKIALLTVAIGICMTILKWIASHSSIRLERVEDATGAYNKIGFCFDSSTDPIVQLGTCTRVLHHTRADRFTVQSMGLHYIRRGAILATLWSDKYGLPPGHPIRVRNSKIRVAIKATRSAR